MKIQFALLSIILLSALAVVIPSNANAQTNDITLTSVLGANICEDNPDCIRPLNSVHFADDKIGWAVGNGNGLILYTTNGGDTWIKQDNVLDTNLKSVHFVDDNNGWVVGDNGVILHTVNGGTAWIEQTSGVTTTLHSVHFVDDNNGWVVGVNGVILHTVNGGTTWTGQISNLDSTLNSVHFADNTFGWVVGEGGVILNTVNGGQAWTKQITDDSDFLNSVHFVDHNYGWAISSGNDASVFFTANGGTTWTEQTIPIKNKLAVLLNSVHFTDSNNGLIVGSYFDSADEPGVGLILYTTNGGATWIEQTSTVPNNLRSVQFTDSNKALVVGGNERDQAILRLTIPLDVITLTPMNSINICGDNADCEKNLPHTNLQSVHFTDSNNGWTVGGSNAILRTTDGGNTWTGQTSTNGNNLNSVHFPNSNNGWAVGITISGSGVIQQTNDDVTAWTGQNIPSGFVGPTPLNSVHFANDDIGWAVGLNYAPQRGVILYTVDGGDTWTEQTSNVNTELRSVHFVDDNNGWAVGDNGVILHTDNGGTAWTEQTSSVTNNLRSVHFVDANNGWAVGVNGVILHTTDGGEIWTKYVNVGSGTLNSVHFTDSNNGWIVGDNQLILYTVNGGATWVDKTPSISSDSLHSVHFTDRNNGWAVGSKANIIHITVTAPDIPIITSQTTRTNENPYTITGTAVEGSTVTLTQNNGDSTSTSTATTSSTGTWSIDVTLIQGANTFTATTTTSDPADIASIPSNSIIVTLDNTAPDTPVITSQTTSTKDNAHTITGTANVGSTVTLTQNNDDVLTSTTTITSSTGTWSVSVTLQDGPNTFTATATDQAGNTSIPSTIIVTLDNTAPDAPVITSPTSTNKNILTIAGTAENDSTITLTQNNGVSILTSTTTSPDDTWSIQVTLQEGENTFTATATDQAGNISDISNSVTITLDTTAPVAPVITSQTASTKVSTHTIAGTAEIGSTITLTQNVTPLEPVTIGTDGAWSVSVILEEGENTFTATATDQAGNTSVVSNSVTVTLDNTAPAAPIITSQTASTNENTLTITGTAEKGSTVTLRQNVTPLEPVTVGTDGAWSIDVTLIQGPTIFTATATDQAGNVSGDSNSVTITLDISPPAAPVITSEAASTNVVTHTITGTAENDSTVTLTQNNGVSTSTSTATTSSTGAWSIDVTLIQDANTFTATATDQAGNTSAASTPVTITLDNTAPIITLTGANPQTIELGVDYTELGATTDDGSEVSIDSSTYRNVVGTYIITYTATDGTNQATATRTVNVVDTTAPAAPVITSPITLTNENTVTITGTTVEGSTVTLTQNDNVLTSTVTIDSDGTWSVDVTLQDGANTFIATATDQADNISIPSTSVTITRDTTAPDAPVITSPTSTNKNTLAITGTAENDSTVTLTQNNGDGILTFTDITNSDGTWSIGVTLIQDATTFTATATDQAGNISAASTPVTITLDTTAPAAPVIASLAEMTSTNTLTITGTAENGSTVTLTQNNNDDLTFTTTTSSTGSWSIEVTLLESTNAFEATATDQAGNISVLSNSVTTTLNNVAPVQSQTQPIMNSPPIGLIEHIPDKSASIKVFDGSQYVDFTDGITIHTGTPKFRGTSDGIDSVKVMIGDSQVGGNKISSDGSFIKGWKGDPLTDGTYSLTVSDNVNPETILFTSYIIIDANSDNNPINAQITKVRVGTEYVPFEHGMTINPETLKFRGTSAGIDSVKVMINGNQVGGNNIRDNGIFAKGWKGDPLTDGKYSLTVSDNNDPETILFTSYIIIQNPVN